MHDDWVLWEKIRSGDTLALKVLHDRYFDQMNLYARKMAGNHYGIEEITSDCFIKLWTKRESILIEKSVKIYLFLMLRNELIDNFRKKNKTSQLKNGTASDLPDEDKFEEFDYYFRLYQALEKLPDQRRRILEKAVFESKTYHAIADELQISVNTVKTQMGRAYRFLKEVLDPKTFQLFYMETPLF